MLKLTLRKEFQGRRLKGTAIELANSSNTGATQIAASEFLDITYPSADALESVEAVGPLQGRPLVLIGERGLGKSHLLAMLYHAFTDPGATREWLGTWAARLGNSKLAELPLRDGMHVISESLHRQSYKFLWDLVFAQHLSTPATVLVGTGESGSEHRRAKSWAKISTRSRSAISRGSNTATRDRKPSMSSGRSTAPVR